jgi:23S rRNA (guanosine2251-2'-O)-methyltransferase
VAEWIYGRNAVHETLRANRRNLKKLLIAQDLKETHNLHRIEHLARQKKLEIQKVQKAQLDRVNKRHQGVALQCSAYPYSDIAPILQLAAARSEDPFLLILDTLQDPQNLGSLLRSAEAVGVHGVFLPARRTASVTPAVVNVSAGASEHMHIAQHNLAQLIKLLKQEEIWVLGLDAGDKSSPIQQSHLKGPLAIVIGSEGQGMRHLVRESCDLLLSLPMRGQIESLNAAVAGSIVLYMADSARHSVV